MALWITGLTQKIEHWAVETRLVYWITARYYQDVIQREIKLANITECDHVLFIGGGVCPCSAILLHQITGAKVTTIDNNVACIKDAKQVIERLGLGDYVQIVCQDGGSANLSLSEYSVVHFALQVFPMEHVFNQVKQRVSPGTKLLIRRPKRRLNKMYGQLPSALLNCCQHINHKKVRNIGSTQLYIKQELSEV